MIDNADNVGARKATRRPEDRQEPAERNTLGGEWQSEMLREGFVSLIRSEESYSGLKMVVGTALNARK